MAGYYCEPCGKHHCTHDKGYHEVDGVAMCDMQYEGLMAEAESLTENENDHRY